MAFPGEVARVPNLSYRMSELGNARIGSLARNFVLCTRRDEM